MQGRRKLEIEICGVKSSGKPRHTSGCSTKDEEVDNISALNSQAWAPNCCDGSSHFQQ